MQKIVGSILIIAAGAGLGITKGVELQKRLSDMREIKRVFLLLKSQIQYTKAPFSSVFLGIARRSEGIYRDWLLELARELERGQGNRIQKIWANGIEQFLKGTQLKQSDLELIKTVGVNMGHLDVETQLGAIQLFLEQWEEMIQKTSAELGAKRRLSHLLGVMGGIFLVILLV